MVCLFFQCPRQYFFNIINCPSPDNHHCVIESVLFDIFRPNINMHHGITTVILSIKSSAYGFEAFFALCWNEWVFI
jgi:hypothetical protein